MSIDSWRVINVMTTNNNLLMDELNVSYCAPKLWLYAMIWLPRTTDNSTHFAQSLEIRGIESRLYCFIMVVPECKEPFGDVYILYIFLVIQ